MRHKYQTRGIILGRSPVGEASVFVTVLAGELGLVRALAQSARRSGAKLASALATLVESDVVLVHGKDGWRLAGAVLVENWFERLGNAARRGRAARVSGLLTRLVAGETPDPSLFALFSGFLTALASTPLSEHETAEILAALRLLAVLGFDAGEIPGETPGDYTSATLAAVALMRREAIGRINHGIAASGL